MDGRKRDNMTKMNSYESAREDARILANAGIAFALDTLKYAFYGMIIAGAVFLIIGIWTSW